MKKTQVALAALALVASTAVLADGVTVSGRIDYAYAADSSNTNDMSGVREGNLAPNFINVTGSEDLGDGLKASFNWVNLVTSSGALANANANVGISNNNIGMKLGRVTDTFLKGVLAFDVTSGGNMGSAVSPILQFGATGAFHSNALQVDTNVGGVNLEATIIGQDSTSTLGFNTAGTDGVAGAYTGAKGDYALSASTDAGGIKLGAAYSVRSTATASTTATANTLTKGKSLAIGAGGTIGELTANVLYMKLGETSTVDSETTVTGFNGSYPIAAAVTLTAGYYDYAGGVSAANDGRLTSLGAKYAFSKMTTGFVNYEKVSGAAQAMRGSVTAGGSAGTNKNIIMIGVAHAF